MDAQRLIPGDATLIENIVNYLKAKGIFDEFRHECLADVDTKSSCQNLSQRVDGYTSKFLANETWHPDLNKNELRNKLRRQIDESGMLALGADHVVEQVINPKIHQLFLPKIIEVVHQYVKEQSELLNKKPETNTSNETVIPEKAVSDVPDSKDKTSISDPIADILSFSYSKSKPASSTSSHIKTENVQHKHTDVSKVEKKKEEKIIPVVEKSTSEAPNENPPTSATSETKLQIDKEKERVRKEEQEFSQEVTKKSIKEEIKPEKKKSEDVKVPVSETTTSVEENKTVVSPIKPTPISKKEFDKSKQKSKSVNIQKSSNSSEIKKPKKESSDKGSEKHFKSKPTKPSKESSSSPVKSSFKSVFKEEKGENSKSKSYDSSSSKTSESSLKKSSKSSTSSKKDNSSSKLKGHSEKSDKSKISKSVDKNESNVHHDSSNSEKGTKSSHYSSSYDSSQGSDQEKSSSSGSKKERQKHFSKHAKKEKSEHSDNNSIKTSSDKKRTRDSDEGPSKKHKNEKDSKHKLKDITVVEAAKISSRSNSFGSTSSVSSSSNASKDNLVSNSDEISENSIKDKKKKQVKEKDSCQSPSKTLPPPPPPPPPTSSLSCELTSSAEMSSVEDTQSSSDSETSSSEEISEESSSDSELESKDLILNTLNESALNSSTDNINAFYDIFLYSSSSSEFEGYGNSPEKKKVAGDELKEPCDSDLSISSVHTSDLSSYDDELSDDDVSFITGGVKRRLTLKEAQELLQNRIILREKNKDSFIKDKSDNEFSPDRQCIQRSSSFLSSDDESSPSEPKRSLRRERKLNPRYASSEYTSIFNSRKETFITKQSNASVKNHSFNSSPNADAKYKKRDLLIENEKSLKKSAVDIKIDGMHQDGIEKSQKCKHDLIKKSQEKMSDSSEMSSSDEIESIMDKNKPFQENEKLNDISEAENFCMKLKPHNNSKLNRNLYSVKRKLEVTESTPVKRPCSRSSVDSSSSEFAPNENKPFNNEKQIFLEEKILKDSNLKTGSIKKDLFSKQRTNNNGDVLGQKDIFSKNSHGRTISNTEKKTTDSEASKEFNSL